MITAKPVEYATESSRLIEALRHLEKLLKTEYAAQRQALATAARRCRSRARRVGLAAGRRAGRHEIEILTDLEHRYATTVRDAQRDCLELSVAIAAEIIAADLAPESDILGRRIAIELEQLLDRRPVSIRVGPHDTTAVLAALEQRAPGRTIKIEPDPSLAAGDAIIETPAGSLRLVWREQLATIRERLMSRLDSLPLTPSMTAGAMQTI